MNLWDRARKTKLQFIFQTLNSFETPRISKPQDSEK